jgi:hypothetical protein
MVEIPAVITESQVGFIAKQNEGKKTWAYSSLFPLRGHYIYHIVEDRVVLCIVIFIIQYVSH